MIAADCDILPLLRGPAEVALIKLGAFTRPLQAFPVSSLRVRGGNYRSAIAAGVNGAKLENRGNV
jgi:hypothetical protein